MSSRPRPFQLVVVGRGRMGRALALASHATLVSARRLNASTLRLQRTRRPVLWVVAVQDRFITTVAQALSLHSHPGDAMIHLAGMQGPDALSPARANNVAVGALHPLIAIAEGNHHPPLHGVYVFQGDLLALRASRQLVRRVGGRVHAATQVDRARYHGAAALIATGGVALTQGAAELFATALSPPLPTTLQDRAMAGLLASVAHNVLTVGSRRALASPLMRGDTKTVAEHLQAMSNAPLAQGLYRAALERVLSVLKETGTVTEETLSRAREVLSSAK